MRTFEKYNATEIYCHYRDAVVNVVGVVGVTGATGAANVSYAGNGFFMTRRHFVVCPAHLVIVPPALGGVNRLPNAPLSQIAPVQYIYVTAFNVNGSNKSYTYRATLVGVDGAGDIALLKLNNNTCGSAPKVKHCHPYLKFGDSLKYSPGNEVYSIGTLFGQDFRSLSTGIVRNNKQFDQTGSLVYEIVGTTLPYDSQRIFQTVYGTQVALTQLNSPDGAPILDVTGHVVGMVTGALNVSPWGTQVASSVPVDNGSVNSDNYAVGVSQRFMKCVLKALIKSYCQGAVRHNTVLLTDTGLTDSTGASLTFYSYQKGYIGAAFKVVSGNFYAGLVPSATAGTGADCTQIVGIVVNPNGASATGFTGVTGDVITHVNCVEIGNLSDQLGLGTFDWRKIAGECSRITLRTQSSSYNSCNESKITYISYPSAFDYSPLIYNGNPNANL